MPFLKTFHFSLFTFHFRRRRGYTLIELIVVLGVLALTVGSITMFLTSILRGTNKANVTAEVKQNGQAVLDSLERQIRGAASVEEVGTNNDYIKLNRDFAEPLHIRCDSETLSHQSRIVVAVSIADGLIAQDSNWRSVSNDNPDSGISIKNCRFTVFVASLSESRTPIPTVVSISFVAKKESQRADFTASAKFETTISLRRY